MMNSIPSDEKSNIQSEIIAIKEQYLLYAGFIGAIIGSILYVIQVITLIQSRNLNQIIPISIVLASILLLAFVRQLDFRLRLMAYVALLFLLGINSLITTGLFGEGRLFFIGAVLLVGLLESRRTTLIVSGLSLIFMIGIAINVLLKVIPQNRATMTACGTDWLVGIVTYTLIAAFLLVITDGISRRFVTSVEKERKLAQQLQNEQINRAETIQQQTEELSRRNAQMELANQIARDIAAETDAKVLFNKTVDLIKDRFGFYHVGIFLLDELMEYAVLRAATGEAGQKLLERKHRLRAGQEGIVGFACGTGEARIALDVGSDAVHFRNPLLPETRSEMALPLKIGSRIIGALDVQSKLESAFTQEDIRILQSIADQLAVGIERSRLVEQLQTSINELTSSSARKIDADWGTFLKRSESFFSYRLSQDKEEKNIPEPAEVKEVNKSGEAVIHHSKESGLETTIIAVPVKIRDQVIGVLDIHYAASTIDPDIKEFINTVANRLALSLENARLFQETQLRVSNERMVRDISAKIQSFTSVDEILRATAGELGKSLGLAEVQIELHTPKN